MTATLEDDLRAAFAMRAAEITVTAIGITSTRSIDQSPDVVVEIRPRRRRLLLPAVAAAAAVALIVTPIVLFGGRNEPARPAGTLEVSSATADFDGMRFPVPDGWSVLETARTTKAVTLCVAEAPAADCLGMSMAIAIADPVDGTFQTIEGPFLDSDCGAVDLEYPQELGGRPAQVFSTACGDVSTRTFTWYLVDGSLLMSTSPGVASAQAWQIADGLDLSDWANSGGRQIAFQTSST